MNKQTLGLIVLVLFLVIAPLSIAEIVSNTTTTNTTTTKSTLPKTTVSGISQTQLTTQLSPLKTQIMNTEKKTNDLKKDLTDLTIKINTLISNVQTLQDSQSSSSSNIESKIFSVSTGLASLQDNLESTEENLSAVQKSVSSGKAFTTFTFLIVLAIVVALAILYFINKKGGGFNFGNLKGLKKTSTPPAEVTDYITSHIKKGNKFPHIKQKLLQAGWSEQEINDAYQATMQQNYQNYLKKKGSTRATPSSTSPSAVPSGIRMPTTSGQKSKKNHKKILMMAGFGLFVLIGILLLLRGVTTGQAIHIKESVDASGKLHRSIECVDNTTMKPDESGCCLDLNANQICDKTEEFEAKKAEEDSKVCNNHNECSQDKKCINNACGYLSEIYTDKCSLTCDKYSVKMLTSDSEEYVVRPNQGGYTSAGSLSWDVIKTNNQCGDGKTPIPVEFTSYKPTKYLDATGQTKTKIETVSKQIITLGKSQTSKTISHPEFKSVAFKLTVDEIFSLC